MQDPRTRRASYSPPPRSTVAGTVEGSGAISGAMAAEFAQRRYGRPTRTEMTDVTFGVASSVLVPANNRRVHWTLINLGVSSAFIRVKAPAVSGAGIPLGAAGGFASMDVNEDGEAVTDPVSGISSGAALAGTLIEIIGA